MSRLFQRPERFADLSHVKNLVDEYRQLRLDIKIKEERMADIRKVLEKEMGRNTSGWASGREVLSWRSRTSERLDIKSLKEAMPGLYKEFSKKVSTRYFIVH